jgi:hypothetical protein
VIAPLQSSNTLIGALKAPSADTGVMPSAPSAPHALARYATPNPVRPDVTAKPPWSVKVTGCDHSDIVPATAQSRRSPASTSSPVTPPLPPLAAAPLPPLAAAPSPPLPSLLVAPLSGPASESGFTGMPATFGPESLLQALAPVRAAINNNRKVRGRSMFRSHNTELHTYVRFQSWTVGDVLSVVLPVKLMRMRSAVS